MELLTRSDARRTENTARHGRLLRKESIVNLQAQMTSQGERLFRWRSYLPLVTAGLFIEGLLSFNQLLGSHAITDFWEFACFGLAIVGLAVRVGTVGFVPKSTSGRNTRSIKGEHLNTTGVYSLMRHPLYVGNFLIWMGAVLFMRDWAVVVIAAAIYWLYYERIMLAEEAYLRQRFGQSFEDWASRTPALLPPLPSNWHRPNFPFCWRTALRREYTTVFMVIGVFTLLETAGRWAVTRRFDPDRFWTVAFSIGLVFYLTTRMVKKHTQLLHVVGR